VPRACSAGIFGVFVSEVGERSCEKIGLDEAFLDVTHLVSRRLPQSPQERVALVESVTAQPTWVCIGPLDPSLPADWCAHTPPLHLVVYHHAVAAFTAVLLLALLCRCFHCCVAAFASAAAATCRHCCCGCCSRDSRLACGAVVADAIRQRIRTELNYTCSAGIAHCKLVAKVVSARNKPDKQTVVPLSAVPQLMHPLPIDKIRSLGGKFGRVSNFTVPPVASLVAVVAASVCHLCLRLL
jgi:nucleotidyltransferase/DNA polymerase involved in DNA repair